LFVAQGYGATSLQEVADRAGVAVQTIYFVFRNKRTLFKDVVDTSIAGDTEPVATMDREWFRAACVEPTAAGQLRAHVRDTREILGRVAPIMSLIAAAAATDPEGRRPRPRADTGNTEFYGCRGSNTHVKRDLRQI
jgi:AcrR family transcriptional regulator